MAINRPVFFLKVIWLTHFVLSSWALLSSFGGLTIYLYTNVAFLACGLWAIVLVESSDAVIMFLATLAVSAFNDILILGLYEPRFHVTRERNPVTTNQRNEYRFALGMCITNLLLKPVSAFVLYRIYQSRASGSEFSYGIPGLDNSRFGGSHGGYNDIESSPGHTTIHVRPNDPPLYQAPAYQEPPPIEFDHPVKA
ncbi:unnamed protein product [Candidula unifasciata]|uniref:Type-1 angiotensin II receptor-associated protein n=1 Tax=Candidula unifasciata TaxID=100452 RepID=A0A8S4A2W4_9EUPU|nr:unnamed protein product [Candidula unifasciata]